MDVQTAIDSIELAAIGEDTAADEVQILLRLDRPGAACVSCAVQRQRTATAQDAAVVRTTRRDDNRMRAIGKAIVDQRKREIEIQVMAGIDGRARRIDERRGVVEREIATGLQQAGVARLARAVHGQRAVGEQHARRGVAEIAAADHGTALRVQVARVVDRDG